MSDKGSSECEYERDGYIQEILKEVEAEEVNRSEEAMLTGMAPLPEGGESISSLFSLLDVSHIRVSEISSNSNSGPQARLEQSIAILAHFELQWGVAQDPETVHPRDSAAWTLRVRLGRQRPISAEIQCGCSCI